MHVEDLDLPEWLSLRAASVALFGAGGVDEGSLQPGQVVDDPTNGGPESDGVVGGGEGGEAGFALGGAAQRSGAPSTLEQVCASRATCLVMRFWSGGAFWYGAWMRKAVRLSPQCACHAAPYAACRLPPPHSTPRRAGAREAWRAHGTGL